MGNFSRRLDFVVGLITGRTKKVKDSEGRVREEFVPNQWNKHPLISVLEKGSPDKTRMEILEKEGLVLPALNINRDVFGKTPREKRYLKKLKAEHKKALINAGFNPKKRLNVSEPMTLHA